MESSKEAMGVFMAKMAELAEEDLFTEEGLKKLLDAMVFLPEQARAGFLGSFVLVGTQM